MHKYGFLALIAMIVVLLWYHHVSLDNMQNNLSSVSFLLDNSIYNYEIIPLVDWIERHPQFQSYNTMGQEEFSDMNDDQAKIGKKLILSAHIVDIARTNEKIQIMFEKSINPGAYNCVYFYTQKTNSQSGKTQDNTRNDQYFEEFGSKFASNRLIKINDNYKKYCSYPLFD